MNFPAELQYSRTHEWVRLLDDGSVQVGISDFAQSELGDLVFVNLPNVGDRVAAGEALCDVESVKAVSDVNAPVSGVVAEVNESLLDEPEKLNEDPYGAWIARIEQVSEADGLLDAKAYEALTEES